jgi:hypothetical protein
MIDPLIYDWNVVDGGIPETGTVMLDDETLRDGLQSPSVSIPTIEQKIEILHLMAALGIDTADLGLPGAGPHVARDVERLAREIVDQRLSINANCAAPTSVRSSRLPSAPVWRSNAVPSSGRARSVSTPRTGRSTTCGGARTTPSRLRSAKG